MSTFYILVFVVIVRERDSLLRNGFTLAQLPVPPTIPVGNLAAEKHISKPLFKLYLSAIGCRNLVRNAIGMPPLFLVTICFAPFAILSALR